MNPASGDDAEGKPPDPEPPRDVVPEPNVEADAVAATEPARDVIVVEPPASDAAPEPPSDVAPEPPSDVALESARERPFLRSEPQLEERGLLPTPSPNRAWSAERRAAVIALGFAAPCAVIALSVYFIVKGAPPRQAPTAVPSGAPQFPDDAGVALPGEPGEASAPNEPNGLNEPDEAAAAAPAAEGSAAPSIEAPMVAVPGFEDEGNDQERPTPQKPAAPKHFATVQEAALGSCSTESVDGLSRQIIEQARCIKPNDFVPLPKRPNVIMAPHVYPYLELSARDHLLKALDAHSKDTMTINSALRTVAQQYLVSHWAATKICGVQLATPPGESNHEIGTALDIAEAAKWRPALEAQQFRWLGASDRVHFDYKGNSGPARTATDVRAFQKLWNRNHPEDAIVENGLYGAPTEQRLKKSPPSGFTNGPSCRAVARKR